MQKRNIHLLLISGLLLLLIVVGILLWLSAENTQYYAYRDLAMASCKSGDMKRSIEYIQIAIQRAKDLDLVGEGLHYQRLFEHNLCEE